MAKLFVDGVETDAFKIIYGCSETEYLCKTCYATVPAKEWWAFVSGLLDKHRYDCE